MDGNTWYASNDILWHFDIRKRLSRPFIKINIFECLGKVLTTSLEANHTSEMPVTTSSPPNLTEEQDNIEYRDSQGTQ